ncbi:MAG: 6-carboxytetrahydropterin synthase [Planctomycetes bacterium]|nr:6-carboxytetrahydropterin synthase [Planctomycetota bacterium]
MVELTQCFEFSASHRLHVPTLSAEENRRVFGKCNNPNGHGHNYQVEVTVAGEVSPESGAVLPLPQFESIVKHEVIDRFDHKHLNTDTADFAARNPSVENIAHRIWELLEAKVSPARLRRVRVWETAKTYAEYSQP